MELYQGLARAGWNDHNDHTGHYGPAVSAHTWTVAEAKAKFSELVDRARTGGPQTVTRNGRIAVVVASAKEWERKTRRPGNLAEFVAESPLRDSGLETNRAKDSPRKIDL